MVFLNTTVGDIEWLDSRRVECVLCKVVNSGTTVHINICVLYRCIHHIIIL